MAAKPKLGKKGQIIHSQTRELVYKVLQFLKEEADNRSPIIPITNYKERLLKATGISKASYERICKEARNQVVGQNEEPVASPSFTSPGKKRKSGKPKIGSVNEREIARIRQIVNNFYIIEQCRPSLKSVYKRIMDADIGFTGGISTMRSLLIRMGFKWQKTSDNRAAIMETHKIRALRVNYLNTIMEYRRDNWNVVYADESYIPVTKGKRLIMVHAGSEGGFIPNALLMFPSGSKSGDYQDDMNCSNFFKWINQQLIPNLPKRSVLVLDNATYHNEKQGASITSTARKEDMEKWLAANDIPFNEGLLRVELYEIIKSHKNKNVTYVLDSLMEDHGHKVLRLPPYHPDLNPIEKIWTLVKNWVAEKNTTFNVTDVEMLTLERFSMLSETSCDLWKNICGDIVIYEKELIDREQILDIAQERLIFSANTGSSDDESVGSEEDTYSDSEEMEF